MRELLSEFYKDKLVISDLEAYYEDRHIIIRRYVAYKAVKDLAVLYLGGLSGIEEKHEDICET
jgi:hypothetical protein